MFNKLLVSVNVDCREYTCNECRMLKTEPHWTNVHLPEKAHCLLFDKKLEVTDRCNIMRLNICLDSERLSGAVDVLKSTILND